MKSKIALYALLLCLALTGCGNVVLERSYSTVSPHSETYWENEGTDTLRADSYQDMVNAIMLLLGEHAPGGAVRVYGEEVDAESMMKTACDEVQQETALGAYLLDYVTYTGTQGHGYYELSVHFGYRRTQEEQAGIINATSTEALPDLLRMAAAEGADTLAVRIGYFATDTDGVRQIVRDVQSEFPALTEAWTVYFYPDTQDAGIVEVFLSK